ncbi:NlpC/P60 family protein [Clostridium sediminicola]|uniref:C40 family peptidase n=1 Tax=Clostridium sediminicola TaxID=3114879 RepID=UPI0031F224F8
MRKRFITIVLSGFIIFSTCTKTVVFADTLQSKLKKQQNELKQSQSNLNKAKKIVEEIDSKIEEFDYQIENTMLEIEELNGKIADTEKKIQDSIEQIRQAEADMEAEKDLYNNRMSAMYMGGKTSEVKLLLGSDTLSDLFSRIQTMKTISEVDAEIIASLKAKRTEIENTKKLMEEKKSELSLMISTQKEKMDKLKNDKKAQQTLIDEAKKELTAYANVVASDKSQIAKTKKLIEAARAKVPKYNPSRGAANVSSNAIVAYASNFLGRPYRWGATGPNSFDCSGFTKYVMAHFGIKIPRTSRSQAKAGTRVSRSNLRPGDLVFFAKPGRAVHHVGIYVGNNSYIHAPRTGDVIKISTLSSRSDYYTARRFTK